MTQALIETQAAKAQLERRVAELEQVGAQLMLMLIIPCFQLMSTDRSTGGAACGGAGAGAGLGCLCISLYHFWQACFTGWQHKGARCNAHLSQPQ